MAIYAKVYEIMKQWKQVYQMEDEIEQFFYQQGVDQLSPCHMALGIETVDHSRYVQLCVTLCCQH